MVDGDFSGAAHAGETALAADAAAGLLSPRGRRRSRGVGGPCANCGAILQGPHCHMCGQVDDDLRRPFWALFMDALEGLFSLDGRILKTVPALLFRPGSVTAAYLAGERARFVQPFRLYLVSAVVFLLAVSFVAGDWTSVDLTPPDLSDNPAVREAAAEGMRVALEEVEREIAEIEAEGDPVPPGLERQRERLEEIATETAGDAAPLDAVERERLDAERRADIKCQIRRGLLPEELNGCPEESSSGGGLDADAAQTMQSWPLGMRRYLVGQSEVIVDNPNLFLEAVNRWLSRVLIGLFPVYALLLGLMHFWRRRFYYYDHVVASLHFHAFLFLLLTLLIGFSQIAPVWIACVAFVLWSNLYVYKTQRLVYGCGRITSALRTAALDFLYFIILSFVPAVLAIGGFLTA